MNMLPNINLIVDSLGWAVLHSLWQGVVAAGIIYVVRNITRERASEARYFTGIITLCALLFAFIATFFYYYNTGETVSSAGNTDIIQTITIGFSPTASAGSPLTRIGDFTGLIGVFWTVCFFVLGVRYMTAFHLTHKLRTTGLSDLPPDWQTRFTALAAKSGVSGKVRAYFSEHVSSPITFGFLKPIVLVPTWFFTGMSAEQCEAILLHELAHIRRHDYLTNILQIVIKTVFFYHPAVQFICTGLDTDREHACDDFAVLLTKKPESLATALGIIRLKSARDGGVFTLSASGADGRDAPLMHRLKRLMGTTSSRTGGKSMQKSTSRGLAAAAMIGSALALVMTLGTTTSQAHPNKNQIEKPDWDKLAGGVPTPNANQNIIINGKTYTPGPSPTGAIKNISKIGDDNGRSFYLIDGKKYSSKYAYDLYSKGGKTFVVKEKNGARYIEIGKNWHQVGKDRNSNNHRKPPLTPRAANSPTTPPPTTNYWVSDQDWLANEKRLERAQKQVEKAKERRAAARERVEERREAKLERAKDIREAALERAAERRAAEMERRQDARAHAKERRVEADVEQDHYHEMRDRLIPVLKADGYLPNKHSKVTLKMTGTSFFINGKQLSKARDDEYCDIISDYIKRKGDIKKIVIKPGYLHVSQKNAGGSSNYTYTHTEN